MRKDRILRMSGKKHCKLFCKSFFDAKCLKQFIETQIFAAYHLSQVKIVKCVHMKKKMLLYEGNFQIRKNRMKTLFYDFFKYELAIYI